jgi:hypothetical protein
MGQNEKDGGGVVVCGGGVVVWGGGVVERGGVLLVGDGEWVGDLDGAGRGDGVGEGLGDGVGDGDNVGSVGIPTKFTGFDRLVGGWIARNCTAMAPTRSTSPTTFRIPRSRCNPYHTTSAPATPIKSPMTLLTRRSVPEVIRRPRTSERVLAMVLVAPAPAWPARGAERTGGRAPVV